MHKVEKEFNSVLLSITDSGFEKDVRAIIRRCPEYIVEVASSTTKKNHPGDEYESDGMIKHINRCIAFAEEYVKMKDWPVFKRDILIAGCILHDLFKRGLSCSDKTHPKHEIMIFDTINRYRNEVGAKPTSQAHTDEQDTRDWNLSDLSLICLLHSGRWVPVEVENIIKTVFTVLCKEEEELTTAMHTIDYFASRRSIWTIMQSQTRKV